MQKNWGRQKSMVKTVLLPAGLHFTDCIFCRTVILFFVSFYWIRITKSLIDFLTAWLSQRGVSFTYCWFWQNTSMHSMKVNFLYFSSEFTSGLYLSLMDQVQMYHNTTNQSSAAVLPLCQNPCFSFCRFHCLLCHTELLFVGAFNCPPWNKVAKLKWLDNVHCQATWHWFCSLLVKLDWICVINFIWMLRNVLLAAFTAVVGWAVRTAINPQSKCYLPLTL